MAEKSSISISAKSPIRSATLLGLPPELHIHIFKHLDIATATCLGLTSKHLYGSFKDAYGHMIPIRLSEQIEVRDEVTTGYFWLSDLLELGCCPIFLGGRLIFVHSLVGRDIASWRPKWRAGGEIIQLISESCVEEIVEVGDWWSAGCF
jgi:hypothetical protein